MRLSFRHYFLMLAAFVLALAAGYGMVRAQQAAVPDAGRFLEGFAAYEIYDPPLPAPPLVFNDLEGSSVRMDELKGGWRLVNLWATWCVSCIIEMPRLLALEEVYKDNGFDIVFVSLDRAESPADLRLMMKRARIPDIETLHTGDTGIWDQLEISGLPTSFLIDPKGRIHYKLIGETDWMAQETLEFVGKLINN